ncbi:MAG: PBP1A family penicillin-binding protein [Synechococcaceae cyanobacterium]|nr:PBP1A family penicillin-binding protein [Synechococcaceae cyanobacterium]
MGLTAGLDLLLPDVRGISSFNRPGTLTILAADGSVVLKQGPATREKLPPGRMPVLIQRAFVAAEDRRFYQHDGVDLQGIGRAMVRNLRERSVEEGASTITQQLARMVFLSQDRTLLRKVKEAALAGKIERQLSKQQILEQYLNFVYLGSSAYGVSDAAWIYFSKKPEQLTLPEAALIAGLPPAPSVYSPLVNPELALERRATVLRRMREAGFIDDAQLASALDAPLGLKPGEPKYFLSKAPWFTSWLEQELPRVLTKEQLEVGGLTVRSGLRPDWQKKAQEVINTYAAGGMEGALVAMEPGTGLVRAMVGGKDWQKSQFNRATQALRSPGSTFKLFAYTAALQYGLKPEDSISNRERCYAEVCIKGSGGSVGLTTAVSRSLNAAAVATAEKVGYPRVVGVARKLGITGEIGEYPSMVLGANEKYVIDMTAAYAAITNRGVYVQPTPFEEVYGPDGELIWSRRVDAKPPKRAVPSEVADAMTWMLQQVVRGGTGSAAGLADRAVAGKTGTSEGARDLWFIGSIPQLTTGIWLGYDNNYKTGSSSVQATYAWHAFMSQAVKGMPVQEFPPKPDLTGKFIPFVPPKKKSTPPPQERPPREDIIDSPVPVDEIPPPDLPEEPETERRPAPWQPEQQETPPEARRTPEPEPPPRQPPPRPAPRPAPSPPVARPRRIPPASPAPSPGPPSAPAPIPAPASPPATPPPAPAPVAPPASPPPEAALPVLPPPPVSAPPPP